MHTRINNKNQTYFENKKMINDTDKPFFIDKYFLRALIIRLIMIAIISYLADSVGTTLYVDDGKFEIFIKAYLSLANSPIDINAFNTAGMQIGGIVSTYSWYWIIAVITYFTKSVWTIRFLNAGLSAYTTILIYKLAKNTCSEKTAILARRIFVYLPYSIISSCFIIKDQLLMLCVAYIVLQVSLLRKKKKINLVNYLIIGLALVVIYYSRSGLAELMVMIIFGNLILQLYKDKKLVKFGLCMVMILIIAFILKDKVIATLGEKINVYINYNRIDSTISFIRVDSIMDIYKLPFAYLFALFQPFNVDMPTISWQLILSYANITLIPMAIGNIIYLVFQKKGDRYVYYSMLAIYMGTIILSIGSARHYYFLLPFTIINFADFYNKRSKILSIFWLAGSIMLLCALIFYYLL